MEPGVPTKRVAALLQRLVAQPSLSARNLTGDPLQSRMKLVNRLLRWLATDPELLSRPGPLLLHVMDLADPVVMLLTQQFATSCGMTAGLPFDVARVVGQNEQAPWLDPLPSHAGKIWQRLCAALQLTGACVLALQDIRAATLQRTELPGLRGRPARTPPQRSAAEPSWQLVWTHELLRALPAVSNRLAQIIMKCYLQQPQRPAPTAPSLRAMAFQQTVLLRYCSSALLVGADIAESASVLAVFSAHVLCVMTSRPQQRAAELHARAGHRGTGQTAAPTGDPHGTGVNATAARLQARLHQRRGRGRASGEPSASPALSGAPGPSSLRPGELPSRADWHGQLRATFALLYEIRGDVQFVPSPAYGSILLELLDVAAEGLQAMDHPDVWENPGAGLDLSQAVWSGHTFGDGPGAFIGGVMSALRVLKNAERSPLQWMRERELHSRVAQLMQHCLALTARLHAQLRRWEQAVYPELCAAEHQPGSAGAPTPPEGHEASRSSSSAAAADPGCNTIDGSSGASTRGGRGCLLSVVGTRSALAFCAVLLDPNSMELLDSLLPETGATVRNHVHRAAKQLMMLLFHALHKVDSLRCAAEAMQLASCLFLMTAEGCPSILLEDLVMKLRLTGFQLILGLEPRITPQHSHAQIMPWTHEMQDVFRRTADMLLSALPVQLIVCEGDTIDGREAISYVRAVAEKAHLMLSSLQGVMPQLAVLMGGNAEAQEMVGKLAAVAQLTRWAAIMALHTHITAVMQQPHASRMPSQAVFQAGRAAVLVRNSRPAVEHAATTLAAQLGAEFPSLLSSMGWWQKLQARAQTWGSAGGGHGEDEELRLLQALEAAFDSLPS